jgi:hypothetical protein
MTIFAVPVLSRPPFNGQSACCPKLILPLIEVAYPFGSSSSSHHLGGAVCLSAGSERLLPKYGCSHSSQMPFMGSLCQLRPYFGKLACNATTLVAVMILLPSSYFAACTGGKCSVKAVGKCAPYTCTATTSVRWRQYYKAATVAVSAVPAETRTCSATDVLR